MRVSIEVVTDAAGLDALEGDWNALLARSSSDSVFLTWEWVKTWWEIYGEHERMYILVARDEAKAIVGIAPLMLSRRRVLGLWPTATLRFIGDGGDVTPEYLDIFTAPALEHAVIAACVTHICADDSVRAIDLRPLAAGGNRAHLEQLLRAQPGNVRCVEDSSCPVFQLPASLNEFAATRSRNYKKKLGEYERRCDRELHVSLRVSRDAHEIQDDMESLKLLHERRWQGESRAFRSERYCEFHGRLAVRLLERDWVRLFTLGTDSTPLALLYCFAYGNRYYFYQGGRDPAFARHRVGLVIMHKVIQEAIKEGAKAFDFLRGDEPYKYRWATTSAHNVRLAYWKESAVPFGVRLFDMRRQMRSAATIREAEALMKKATSYLFL